MDEIEGREEENKVREEPNERTREREKEKERKRTHEGMGGDMSE